MRIQFDITDEQVNRLDGLMEVAGISTRKDLFNYALTIFEWAIDVRRSGRRVVGLADHERRFQELIMPPLETAARTVREGR